jgi:hypothetical protein
LQELVQSVESGTADFESPENPVNL